MTSLPNDIELRPATTADALCLGALATQVFFGTYATEGIWPGIAREALAHFSIEAMAARIAAPDSEFIVAERGRYVVGFAQLRHGATHDFVRAAPTCELARLYVQERFTGAGLGARLLRESEARAAGRGAGALWLTTWVGNQRARAFYARQGYRDVGSTPYVFDGDAYENRVFVRELDPRRQHS
jgi:ribosomal protein S18 acetylase RimI-like enzyme